MLRIYVGFQAIKFQCFLPVPPPPPPPPPPPAPPPHFYCFPPPPPHFYCFSLLLLLLILLLLLLVLLLLLLLLLLILLFSILSPLVSFFFSSRDSIKDCQLPSLIHFEAMSRVLNNNRGCLQLLADCSAYQREFLLKTATPQQLHALVQVSYDILMGHIPVPEENKRILLPYKDALLDLASPNVPYKTKKRVLVQEGSGFIEDVLARVVSIGFLRL